MADKDPDAPESMTIIAFSGDLDKLWPTFILSSTGAASGMDVTVFFTFWGLDMINKHRVDKLEIPPVGNASMKMNLMGVPGYVGIPQFMGMLPGMTPFATALMNKKMKELGVPPVREYL